MFGIEVRSQAPLTMVRSENGLWRLIAWKMAKLSKVSLPISRCYKRTVNNEKEFSILNTSFKQLALTENHSSLKSLAKSISLVKSCTPQTFKTAMKPTKIRMS